MKKISKVERKTQNWKQTSFASQYRYDIAGSRARRFQSAYLKLIAGTIFLTFTNSISITNYVMLPSFVQYVVF